MLLATGKARTQQPWVVSIIASTRVHLQLNDAFLQFAAYGTRQPETQMDGKNFSKLCKDCGLIDKKFSLTDADLTFSKVSKQDSWSVTLLEDLLLQHADTWWNTLNMLFSLSQVKTKGARKISFLEFKKAVAAIAAKKVNTHSLQLTSMSRQTVPLEFPFSILHSLIYFTQGLGAEAVEEVISNSGGPKTQATKADYVKFHDDKTTYTGVYAK